MLQSETTVTGLSRVTALRTLRSVTGVTGVTSPPARSFSRWRRWRPAAQLGAALALGLALASCGIPVDQRGNLPDERNLSQIKPGETDKATVTRLINGGTSGLSDRIAACSKALAALSDAADSLVISGASGVPVAAAPIVETAAPAPAAPAAAVSGSRFA